MPLSTKVTSHTKPPPQIPIGPFRGAILRVPVPQKIKWGSSQRSPPTVCRGARGCIGSYGINLKDLRRMRLPGNSDGAVGHLWWGTERVKVGINWWIVGMRFDQ